MKLIIFGDGSFYVMRHCKKEDFRNVSYFFDVKETITLGELADFKATGKIPALWRIE